MATISDESIICLDGTTIYTNEKSNTFKKSYKIQPVKEYTKEEIRRIRMQSGMTQRVFAYYMGVSIKTVEAWEGGRSCPTGPAYRLLDILASSDNTEFIIENF